MAATFRSKTEVGAGGADTNSITIGAPAGLAVDDLMIAVIATAGGVITPPAGWTLVESQVDGGTSSFFAEVNVYKRVAVAGDGVASWQWTNSVTVGTVGAIYAYQDPSSRIDVLGHAGAGGTADGTTATAPAVTGISVSGYLNLSVVCATSVSGVTPTYTPAAGTERSDFGAATFTSMNAIEDATDPNATRTTTISTSSGWAAAHLVIGPLARTHQMIV